MTYRARVPMTPETRRYSESVSEKCKRKGGGYVDLTVITRALIEALRRLESQIDLRSVETEGELIDRLVEAFRRKQSFSCPS